MPNRHPDRAGPTDPKKNSQQTPNTFLAGLHHCQQPRTTTTTASTTVNDHTETGNNRNDG